MVKLLRGRGKDIEFDINRGPLKLDASFSQAITRTLFLRPFVSYGIIHKINANI